MGANLGLKLRYSCIAILHSIHSTVALSGTEGTAVRGQGAGDNWHVGGKSMEAIPVQPTAAAQ